MDVAGRVPLRAAVVDKDALLLVKEALKAIIMILNHYDIRVFYGAGL